MGRAFGKHEPYTVCDIISHYIALCHTISHSISSDRIESHWIALCFNISHDTTVLTCCLILHCVRNTHKHTVCNIYKTNDLCDMRSLYLNHLICMFHASIISKSSVIFLTFEHCIALHRIMLHVLHYIAYITLYRTTSHYITLYRIIFQYIAWYHIILHYITLYHIISHNIEFYFMMSQHITLYRIMSPNIAWYHIILHYTPDIAWCWIILHYIAA